MVKTLKFWFKRIFGSTSKHKGEMPKYPDPPKIPIKILKSE